MGKVKGFPPFFIQAAFAGKAAKGQIPIDRELLPGL